jgi:hypothetical protein
MQNDNIGLVVLIVIGLIGIGYNAILYSKARIPVWQILFALIPFIGPLIMWIRLLMEWPIERQIRELHIYKAKAGDGDEKDIEAWYQFADSLSLGYSGKTDESRAIEEEIAAKYPQSKTVAARKAFSSSNQTSDKW